MNGSRVAHRSSDSSIEPLFRLFVESVKDYAIFMLDRTGHVISWNAGAERIKGYKPTEIIGSHFSRFYPPEDIAARKPDRELEAAAVDGRIEDEGWRVRKDGTRFWANVIITAVHDANGELAGFGKVTRDMTQVRQHFEENQRLTAAIQRHADELEEEVARRTREIHDVNAELRQANAALNAFTQSVAHDLRGPLRTIQGFAEILAEDHAHQLDETGRDYTRRISGAARRLADLVQNLLTYARLTRSRASAALEPVSWDRTVHAVLRELQADMQRAGATVTVRGSLGHVLGHRETLAVVVRNLLTNAIKFVAPLTPPRIEIWAERHGSRIRLNVGDNGIGVPQREQTRIFTPFERLHANAVYAGTGLGLAIVMEAILRLGGSLGVESDGRSGSCFWVSLDEAPAHGGHTDGSANPAG